MTLFDPLPPNMYLYIYKICIYFTSIKYIYTHICIFFVSLLKLAVREGAAFSTYSPSARERRNGGFCVCWTFFDSRHEFSLLPSQQGGPVAQPPPRVHSARPAWARPPQGSPSRLASVALFLFFSIQKIYISSKIVFEGWVAGTCTEV